MVAAADPSWQLSHRSAVSGLALFNLALVTFGYFGPGFGAGTTPKYQAALGPDPLAILAVVTSDLVGFTTPRIPPAAAYISPLHSPSS